MSSSVETIHQLLQAASTLLNQAATDIRDAGLDPVRGNIERIARALAEIFEIKHRIYQANPSLKPEYLDMPSPHPDANRTLARVVIEACELEDAGRVLEAVKVYREYLDQEISSLHREIAESEIVRLSGN